MHTLFNRFLPCTTYRLYFERYGQMISHMYKYSQIYVYILQIYVYVYFHKYMYIYIYIYIYIYMIIYKSLNDPGLYLFADDTCIFYQDKDVERIEKVLNK